MAVKRLLYVMNIFVTVIDYKSGNSCESGQIWYHLL